MFRRKSKFAWMTCHEGYDGIFWRSNPNPNALLRYFPKIVYGVVFKLSWRIKLFIFNTYVVTKHHGFDMPLLIWSVNKMRKCGKLDPILQYRTKIVQKKLEMYYCYYILVWINRFNKNICNCWTLFWSLKSRQMHSTNILISSWSLTCAKLQEWPYYAWLIMLYLLPALQQSKWN